MKKSTKANPTTPAMKLASREPLPREASTTFSVMTWMSMGRRPDSIWMARSLTCSALKPPEIWPLPARMGERMVADYQSSLLTAYASKRRYPWNVGHHFAQWHGGAYWRALQTTITFAAKGCPDARGALGCRRVAFPSFRKLARRVVRLVKRAKRAKREK